MIIPSQTKRQTDDTLADMLDNVLEKALAEIPQRVIPVVPQRDLYEVTTKSNGTNPSVGLRRTWSRPFIDAAVMETIRKEGHLVIDVDLTGREVSSTSTDYHEASFGWMEDGISKGYQAAVTLLVRERWKRLMLTLQRYTGRTLSAECLQAAVQAVPRHAKKDRVADSPRHAAS